MSSVSRILEAVHGCRGSVEGNFGVVFVGEAASMVKQLLVMVDPVAVVGASVYYKRESARNSTDYTDVLRYERMSWVGVSVDYRKEPLVAWKIVAAENGATAHELMAIFGWLSLKEAERYTRGAERRKLAERGMGLLVPLKPRTESV
jgi:hypothetical protein